MGSSNKNNVNTSIGGALNQLKNMQELRISDSINICVKVLVTKQDTAKYKYILTRNT